MRVFVTFFSLLFLSFTVSAQNFDAAGEDIKLSDQNLELQDFSNWLNDRTYYKSRLILHMTYPEFQKEEKADQLLAVFSAVIYSADMDIATWHRLARYCHDINVSKNSLTKIVKWCNKNQILNKYQKLNPDNAYAYLFRMKNNEVDTYGSLNKRLLKQAAAAKFANDYFGYDLKPYISHLRKYYRQEHKKETVPAGYDTIYVPEDAFVLRSAYMTTAAFITSSRRIFSYCSDEKLPEKGSFRADCIKLMALFRTNANTQLEYLSANAVLSRLLPAGSAAQIEAERQKLSRRLVTECISGWGSEESAFDGFAPQAQIAVKVYPLYEAKGEIEAWAIASDQYYEPITPKGEPLPSSCLELESLDLEAAKNLLAQK